MEETHELHIAAEPEGLAVGNVVGKAVAMIVIPIVSAVLLMFPLVNKSVQTISMQASSQVGSPVKSNADAEAAMKLNNYAVVDRTAGLYQIPVERAIEIMVSREASRSDRIVSTTMPR
jgi:hypothetical protein